MRPSTNEAETHSAEPPQKRSLPKWIERSLVAVVLIYTFCIAIPGMFNVISMAMEHHPSQIQLILNTVFIASNLFLSLSVIIFLVMPLLFNRTVVHPWRQRLTLFLLAVICLGCAYDSLAHLVPGESLPLLVDVLTHLAPGPMAIFNELEPILTLARGIWAIVNTVRSARPMR